MAKSETLLSLRFLIANSILVLNNVVATSNVLTVRMIYRYSPESPFFQGNLSREELIRMQTKIDAQKYLYIAKIGIGTFKSNPPYKEYYLEMDTGSSLTWLQCEGCTRCFNQTPKPFPKNSSLSFRPFIVGNEPEEYEIKYADGAITRGMLARETFYLRSNTGGLAPVKNMQFGCGMYNLVQYGEYKNNKIAGIMGLGWEELLMVNQLGPQFNGVFSYCLPPVSQKTPSTFLRFGEDVSGLKRNNAKSTPLYRIDQGSSYYVEVQGISINKKRLKIKAEVFAYKKNSGNGGVLIDSGTPYSRLVGPAFNILKVELEIYFARMKGIKKIGGESGLEVCFERKRMGGLNKLPDITFHLRGSNADFVIKAEAVFEVTRQTLGVQYFCLAMLRDNVSIIGSIQQTNHRIIHDTKKKILFFYREDCSRNP